MPGKYEQPQIPLPKSWGTHVTPIAVKPSASTSSETNYQRLLPYGRSPEKPSN